MFQLCFLFEKDPSFFKEERKNISLFNYPQLLHLVRPPLISKERREREGMLFTPPSHSSPIIEATTFMHDTEEEIESIHWSFIQ